MKFLSLLLLLSLPLVGQATAHEQPHTKSRPAPKRPLALPQAYEKINESYRTTVRPIFVQKCFDCHSDQTRYPWYYRLPLARQLIDHDTREAKEHLDMSQSFPFGGHHHDPAEQLTSLAKVIRKDSMPLRRYRLLHPGSNLGKEEKRAILKWLEESKTLLEEKGDQRGRLRQRAASPLPIKE